MFMACGLQGDWEEVAAVGEGTKSGDDIHSRQSARADLGVKNMYLRGYSVLDGRAWVIPVLAEAFTSPFRLDEWMV